MNFLISVPLGQFTFTLHPVHTRFNRIAGLYAFFILPPAELQYISHIPTETPLTQPPKRHAELPCPPGRIEAYTLLYIGITNNFYTRLKQHHKIEQAIELGMTHIGILKLSSGRKRKATERQLLKAYNPPLNQTWLYDFDPAPVRAERTAPETTLNQYV